MSQSSVSVTRRGFLNTAGAAAALPAAPSRQGLPKGAPLRVKPILVWSLAQRRELTSWRPYGGLVTRQDVDAEMARIAGEMKALASNAEFPLEPLPVGSVSSAEEAAAAARDAGCDAFLLYAAAGPVQWYETLTGAGKPALMFLRQRSGPFYLYYEIAHFRFLRKSLDTQAQPHMDHDDIVVDDYGDVLWRLRGLYGLKNARGTKSLALGGLRSYSAPGQKLGPTHVREVWGYELIEFPDPDLEKLLAEARADAARMRQIEQQAAEFLAQPNLTLETQPKFVLNTFVALDVVLRLMSRTGATNVGVANCMGSLIKLMDTPPCLLLSLLNDMGHTAFCHTDYTHTPPGVLLRWISGKPSFVSNSHFPHHGMLTLAHCATPRRMNGVDYEPSKLVTHFESDYGAATRVEFRKGQTITNIIPNLVCTKWFGFRGDIVDTPNYPACRSQIDMRIDGDWKRLLREMQGFHTVTCYGDYLRETGYALKKLGGIEWENLSA